MKIKDKILSETSEEVKQRVRDTANKLVIKQETLKEVKDLTYWRKNAEEDYIKVPISVLRYITELEERSYSEEEVLDILYRFHYDLVNSNIDTKEEWFKQFKKK